MKIHVLRRLSLSGVAVAITGALLGSLVLAPSSMAASPNRYITITSDGTVKTTPDAVRINATVSVVAATSKDALAKSSSSAAAIRAALLANGVLIKYIATQTLTVAPEYSYTQDKGSVLIGYRGSQNSNIVVRNAASAGAVVDAIVAAGGDNLQIGGVNPFVFDPSVGTTFARIAAVKNAKAKAVAYVKLLGVKLGKVNYLIENSSPSFTPPIYSMAKELSGATQIDLGQQDVTVSITVQWSLL